MSPTYSPLLEAQRILQLLCRQAETLGLPESLQDVATRVKFGSDYDQVYFPIPFKETETAAALKAVEGGMACLLADLECGERGRVLGVGLEKTTNFLFQAYLATVDGLGKLDPAIKSKLKDTDYLRAQSDPYRRMSANLYETKRVGEYYHIHGSLNNKKFISACKVSCYVETDVTYFNSYVLVQYNHFTARSLVEKPLSYPIFTLGFEARADSRMPRPLPPPKRPCRPLP